MAKTSAERMRELRERTKDREKEIARALKPTTFRKPLSDFFAETGRTGFAAHLSKIGHDWWDFSTDAGVHPLSDDALDDEEKQDASNSLGKAELLLSVLEDITNTLTDDVNTYKRKEITDRIHEIETSDLSNPDARKQAVTDIVRLKKMLEQLDKQVRRTFPQWEVSGE